MVKYFYGITIITSLSDVCVILFSCASLLKMPQKRMFSETDNSSWCSNLASEELRSFATLGLRGLIPVICVCSNKGKMCVCACVCYKTRCHSCSQRQLSKQSPVADHLIGSSVFSTSWCAANMAASSGGLMVTHSWSLDMVHYCTTGGGVLPVPRRTQHCKQNAAKHLTCH